MDDSNTPELEQGTAASEVVETTEQSTPGAGTPNTLHDAVLKAFEKQEEKADTNAEKAAEAPKEEAPAKEIDPITGKELEPIKAPGGWTPKAREHWNALPRSVQEEVHRRERETSMKMQEVSDERKLANEFKSAVAPYETTFRQYGVTAMSHVSELLKYSHHLQLANPVQRGEAIADLVVQYGADLNAFNQRLAGRQHQPQVQQPTQPINVQAEIDKAFKAREEQQRVDQGIAAANAFAADPANEFYQDVHEDMLVILNAGRATGATVEAVLKDAYTKACKMHPEISEILAQRSAPKASAPAARPVGSVKPSLGTGRKNAPARRLSAQEAIERAWGDLLGD